MPASMPKSKASFLGFRSRKGDPDDILDPDFENMLEKKVRGIGTNRARVEIKRAKRRKKAWRGRPDDVPPNEITLQADFARMLEEKVKYIEMEEKAERARKEKAERMDKELIDTEMIVAAPKVASDRKHRKEDPHGVFCCLPLDRLFHRLDRWLDSPAIDRSDRTAADSWDMDKNEKNSKNNGETNLFGGQCFCLEDVSDITMPEWDIVKNGKTDLVARDASEGLQRMEGVSGSPMGNDRRPNNSESSTSEDAWDIAKKAWKKYLFGGLDEVDDRAAADNCDAAKNGESNLVAKDASEGLRRINGASQVLWGINCCPRAPESKPEEVGVRPILSSPPTSPPTLPPTSPPTSPLTSTCNMPERLQGIDRRLNALELKPEEVGAQTILSQLPASTYDMAENLREIDRRLDALESKPEDAGVQTILSPPSTSSDYVLERLRGIDRRLSELELKPEEAGVQTILSPPTLSYDVSESLEGIDRRVKALELSTSEDVGVQTILSPPPTLSYDVSESLEGIDRRVKALELSTSEDVGVQTILSPPTTSSYDVFQRMDLRLNALEWSTSEDTGSPDPGHYEGPAARFGPSGNSQAGGQEVILDDDRACLAPTPGDLEECPSIVTTPGPTSEKVAAKDATIEPAPDEAREEEADVAYHTPVSVQESATAKHVKIEPSPWLIKNESCEVSDVIHHKEAGATRREPVPIRTIDIVLPQSKLSDSVSKLSAPAGETKRKSFRWVKSRRGVARKESKKASTMKLDVRPGRTGAATRTKRRIHRSRERGFASATRASGKSAPGRFARFPEGTHPLEV